MVDRNVGMSRFASMAGAIDENMKSYNIPI
jgi:hypothetical protein